jgi:hypothetical protein
MAHPLARTQEVSFSCRVRATLSPTIKPTASTTHRIHSPAPLSAASPLQAPHSTTHHPAAHTSLVHQAASSPLFPGRRLLPPPVPVRCRSSSAARILACSTCSRAVSYCRNAAMNHINWPRNSDVRTVQQLRYNTQHPGRHSCSNIAICAATNMTLWGPPITPHTALQPP